MAKGRTMWYNAYIDNDTHLVVHPGPDLAAKHISRVFYILSPITLLIYDFRVIRRVLRIFRIQSLPGDICIYPCIVLLQEAP